MVGKPPRVPTAGDPAGYGERWGRVRWRRQGYGNRGRGCADPGRDGDVELHESGYWDVRLCTGVGDSGGAGASVGVEGADGVGTGSGGGVGSGCGDSDSGGSIGGN